MRFLWNRQPGETLKAFSAFEIYLKLGPERDCPKVSAACGRHVSLLGRWKVKWKWDQRVTAWDDERQRLEMEAVAKESVREAAEWRERSKALRQKAWEVSQALVDRAAAMLRFPLSTTQARVERYTEEEIREAAEKKTPLVKNVTNVHPARWTAESAARFMEAGARLGWMASGTPMDIEAQVVTGPGGGPVQVQSIDYVAPEHAEAHRLAREAIADAVNAERAAKAK